MTQQVQNINKKTKFKKERKRRFELAEDIIH